MSLSDPNPALKFRSVGGQILLASFWTLVVVCALTSICGFVSEFGHYNLPDHDAAVLLENLLGTAKEIAIASGFFLSFLSVGMALVYKPFGILGLATSVPAYILMAIPHFSL
jgi:hypothetical protein